MANGADRVQIATIIPGHSGPVIDTITDALAGTFPEAEILAPPDEGRPQSSDEARVVVCNYLVATKDAVRGARAYVVLQNPGNASDRILVYARSRGSRWIKRWEDSRRLANFRIVTLMKVSVPDRMWDALTAGGHQRDATQQTVEWVEWMNGRTVETE